MLNLKDYRDYWEGVARRVPEISGAMPVTADEAMAKRIMGLSSGSVTLFYLPPAAESEARNADAFRESNECVVFVMEKYDTLRRAAFDVLESSKPAIERVKALMLADMAGGCPLMRFDPATMNTLPETGFFAGFAGWSLGFKVYSHGV